MNLTMNERSVIAVYAAPTQAETLERMAEAPVEEMDPEIQTDFFSALRKLKAMDERDFQALDLRDTLLTDEEEQKEAETNAGA